MVGKCWKLEFCGIRKPSISGSFKIPSQPGTNENDPLILENSCPRISKLESTILPMWISPCQFNGREWEWDVTIYHQYGSGHGWTKVRNPCTEFIESPEAWGKHRASTCSDKIFAMKTGLNKSSIKICDSYDSSKLSKIAISNSSDRGFFLYIYIFYRSQIL